MRPSAPDVSGAYRMADDVRDLIWDRSVNRAVSLVVVRVRSPRAPVEAVSMQDAETLWQRLAMALTSLRARGRHHAADVAFGRWVDWAMRRCAWEDR